MRSAAAVFVAVVAAAGTAAADEGELALGPQFAGAYEPAEGRPGFAAGLAMRRGATDWVSLEARLGAGLNRDDLLGHVGAGLVIAWDVLAWVPEATFLLGARLDGDVIEPRVSAELGVRRYFGMSLSVGLAGGGEWGAVTGGMATMRATLWLSLD